MELNHVWYACYGSNLSRERFLCYIQGGYCRYNHRVYQGCTDQSDPLIDRPVIIPHQLYYANRSGSWDGYGVAFLDPYRNNRTLTLGRMYLITEEQLLEIHTQEGKGSNWYDHPVVIGKAEGYKVCTFTNSGRRPFNSPSDSYLAAIADGLKETYPYLNDEWIRGYLSHPFRLSGFRTSSRITV